jgi:hypothetical protein
MTKFILISFVLALGCASCTKDDPITPPITEFSHTQVGSSYIFGEYATDSTSTVIEGSRDTVVSIVLQTDGSISMKSNVLVVEEKRGDLRDTMYYKYESNNNLSVYVKADGDFGLWETLPTGTGTRIVRATDYSFIGIDTNVTWDSTITALVGIENLTIKGQSVSVKKMLMTFRHVVTLNGEPWIDTQVDNFVYYAPSLGMIVKTSSEARPDPFGGWINGTSQTLIDYELK